MKSLGAFIAGYGIGLILGVGTPDGTTLTIGLVSFVVGLLMILLYYFLKIGEQ